MSEQRVFAFAGGLNLDGVTLAMKPGEATLLENYELLPTGSYRRFEGYERFDGHPQPSLAVFYRMPFVAGLAAGIAVGATIVGATSAAVGEVLKVTLTSGSFAANTAAGEIVVRQVSGLFAANEALRIGGIMVAHATEAAEQGGPTDADFDDLAAQCADAARAHIGPPPGSGPVLGVVVFQGLVHAFRNAENGESACMYVESPDGWVLAKSGLAPDGRYEFKINNFAGGSGTRYLYGVSGTHKGFEWTGDTWTFVTTGMADDRPTHLAVWKNALVYAYRGGSLQNSGIGTPLDWSVRTGAAEIGMGDDITGLAELVGGTLAIYCRQKIGQLSGAPGTDSLALDTLAPDAGAFPYSVQNVPGRTLSVDERGIMPLDATQAYGNFSTASVSQRVQKLIDVRADLLVDSAAIRAKSQYRLFYSDGVCICVTFKGTVIVGYSVLRLSVFPTCVFVGRDPDGKEIVVFGASNGMVYRSDVGMSFDGVAIDALLRTAPDAINSPRQIKQFQNLLLQVSTPRPLRFQVQAVFDYELSPSDITQTVTTGVTFSPSGWDLGNWDEISFDAGDERPGIAEPANRIDGAANNVSFALYHGGEVRPAFTLEAGIIVYRNRGFRR